MPALTSPRAVAAGIAIAAGIAAAVVALVPQLAAPTDATAMPLDAQPFVVQQVVAGDTLVLETELPGPQVREPGTLTARLLSIDAPGNGIAPECFGAQAQERLAELLPPGSVAWASTDVEARDGSGRLLVNVWAPDGRFVNYLLVVDGFARAELMEPNVSLWDPVQRAAASAAARFGGLWGQCR